MNDIKDIGKEPAESASKIAADAVDKAKEAGQAALDAASHIAAEAVDKARHGLGNLLHKAADKLKGA